MAAETATPVQAPATAEQEAPPTIEQPIADLPTDADAKKASKKDGKKDGKKDAKKKPKKGAEDAEEGSAADGPSVAGHPRAARAVARAKSWGGLLGFALAGYMSLPTSTVAQAGFRALAAGVICYVATWAGAVFVWRRFVILEIKAREQQLMTAAVGADPTEAPRARAGS